jgi:hypothetical protein
LVGEDRDETFRTLQRLHAPRTAYGDDHPDPRPSGGAPVDRLVGTRPVTSQIHLRAGSNQKQRWQKAQLQLRRQQQLHRPR